jgi:NTE family protein
MTIHTAIDEKTVRPRNGKTRPLNLALQGMGAHGAFGWGILDKLLEDGRIDITGISATSAGAMNAVVFAYGQLKGGKPGAREALEKFWRETSLKSAWSFPAQRTPMDAMFSLWGMGEPIGENLIDGLSQFLSPYDFNPMNLRSIRGIVESIVDFEELRRSRETRLLLGATDVKSGLHRTFGNARITSDVVLASACIPTSSHAVEIDGRYYWDGAYSGHPSLTSLAGDFPATDILIAQISRIERRRVPKSAGDIRARISELAVQSALLNEARLLNAASQAIHPNWLLPEHREKLRPVHVHAVHSNETICNVGRTSVTTSDWRTLTKLRDWGRLTAEIWLESHFEKVGVASTADGLTVQ